jgi:hypothetical protein
VEGVYTNAEVERILAGGLGNVLVGANTGGFEGLRRKLLILIGDKVAAEGELIDRGALTAEIVNADLSVGASSVSITFNDKMTQWVMAVPLGPEHHGCTSTWGTACSCSSDSSELVGGPFSTRYRR